MLFKKVCSDASLPQLPSTKMNFIFHNLTIFQIIFFVFFAKKGTHFFSYYYELPTWHDILALYLRVNRMFSFNQPSFLYFMRNKRLFIILAFFLYLPFSIAQTTRYATNFSTLSSAITSSSTSVVDIIEISNDIVVTAALTINKAITINGNGNVLTVSVPGVSDLGVNNLSASTNRIFTTSGSGKITLNNIVFKGGNIQGACVYNTGTKLYLNNCTISNGRNNSGGGGGLYNGGTLYMTDCMLLRNSASYGGGFLNMGSSTIFANRCTFSENRSESSAGGGGGCENQGTLYMNNCTFSNNKSTEIGGGINNYRGTLYLVNTTFSGNVAYGSFSGGAVGINGGSIYLVNCLFAYNYKLSGGSSSSPTAFTLDDFQAYSGSANVYYTIYHSSINTFNTSTSVGNIQYTGTANGSDNSIFAGGILTKITDGTGTEIGTATVFQPYLVTQSGSKTATLKIGSYPNTSSNKGVKTGYTDGSGTPSMGYYSPTTSSWVNIVGSAASSNVVTADQMGTTRSTSTPTRGSIEGEISSVYMIKVLKVTNGSTTGATLYGDVYPSGTKLTLTASPNTGYQFTSWKNTATGSTYSTSNPLNITLTSDLTLEPIFSTTSSYSVTYIGNNNTDGTAPSVQTFGSGGSVTLSTKNTLIRDDYYFSGWNTNATGTGTNYAAGATYSTTANLTLYAVWTPYIRYYAKSGSVSAINATSAWSSSLDGSGVAPSNFGSDKIFILNNSAGSSSFSTSGNLTILGALEIPSGKTLNITTGTTLTVSGDISNAGTIVGAAGSKLVLNGTSMQYLSGNGQLANLTVNNSGGLTSRGVFSVTDSLTITAGTFVTNDSFTFKSSASKTAVLSPVNSGSISGLVTVERYIPARRAYRLLSAPVTTTTSIYQNWQESGRVVSGLGTHITGSVSGANGFDATQTGNASLFTHDNTTGVWSGIANTNATTFTAGNAYRLMVRGDRTVSLATNTPTPTNTVLRTTGTLQVGNKTFSNLSQSANGFSFVGNPYQASVDMNRVLSNATNVNTNYYYVWDPNISTRGAYVTVNVVNNSNASGSAANRFLQPGQAFFVKTTSAGSASLPFTEASKGVSFTSVFKIIPAFSTLVIQLNQTDSLQNQAPVLDGLEVQFDDRYTDTIDQWDALKPTNQDENLAVEWKGKNYSVWSQTIPGTADTIHLFLNQLRDNNYTLKFAFNADLGVDAYLVDHYLNSKLLLNAGDQTQYQFLINTQDANSKATNRFDLVFVERASNAVKPFATNQNAVRVSPNPAKEQVNITLPQQLNALALDSELPITVSIFDMLGKEVFSRFVNAQEKENGVIATVLPADLKAGYYMVKLEGIDSNGQPMSFSAPFLVAKN